MESTSDNDFFIAYAKAMLAWSKLDHTLAQLYILLKAPRASSRDSAAEFFTRKNGQPTNLWDRLTLIDGALPDLVNGGPLLDEWADKTSGLKAAVLKASRHRNELAHYTAALDFGIGLYLTHSVLDESKPSKQRWAQDFEAWRDDFHALVKRVRAYHEALSTRGP
jgi:hypothetical protein